MENLYRFGVDSRGIDCSLPENFCVYFGDCFSRLLALILFHNCLPSTFGKTPLLAILGKSPLALTTLALLLFGLP